MLKVSLHNRDTGQSASSHSSQPLVPGPLREWEGVLGIYADTRGKLAA